MIEVRKLVDIGNARGISLPAAWLAAEELRLGHTIEHVILDLSDHSIIVKVEGGINKSEENPASIASSS